MLSLLSSAPSPPPITFSPDCGGRVGGALEVLMNEGGCMVEGELAFDEGVARCSPGATLRMKFMVALGFVSAREKRPEPVTAEGGNGVSGRA